MVKEEAAKITWHHGYASERDRGKPPSSGVHHARAGGKVIATVRLRANVPSGYANRYRGDVYGRDAYADTLTEFKQRVRDACDRERTERL